MLTVTTREPLPSPEFMERHYTLSELALQWRTCERTLKTWFADEPDIIRFGREKLTKSKKRAYVSMRIPESVALRVYRKMTGGEIQQPPIGR
jgi:hypothetical protein